MRVAAARICLFPVCNQTYYDNCSIYDNNNKSEDHVRI